MSEVKKFGLIGFPLGHSLSVPIHQAGFKSMGIDATYELLETRPEELVDRVKYLKTNNFSGFNITIPLKLPITMFLDEIDESADVIKAINTVIINPETKSMKGYNTDVTGFGSAIPEDFVIEGKVAGILGTGGAARAAITHIALQKAKEIKLYTRNIPNSIELVEYLRKTFPEVVFTPMQIIGLSDLSEVDILINTTPIGMFGKSCGYSPVEEEALTTMKKEALVYDVIYNPKKTQLINLAQKHGYRTVTGLDMFAYQAWHAQKIWFNQTPDFKDMKIAALENL